MTRSRHSGAIATFALALAIASCGSEPAEPEPAAPQAPEGPAGIAVTDGWMSLPAVAGNPGAVYFTLTNSGEEAVSILAADVRGAGSAMLHESGMNEMTGVTVQAGERVVFEPGEMHVMVMEPGPSLTVGGETELTLTFHNGDKASVPIIIRAPGDEGVAS